MNSSGMVMRDVNLHLWIYNHHFHGISDQADFFVSAFRQQGYLTTVGRTPKKSALNVVIENFSDDTRDVLIKFCKNTNKRVAVIMTEHLDFIDEEILIHGETLNNSNDYMDSLVQAGRIRSLMECAPYVRCMFVLGDLPELTNMSSMLPGIDVRSIPFPRLDFVDNAGGRAATPKEDLVFAGFMTKYRSEVFEKLQKFGFSVNCPNKFVSRRRRDKLVGRSKVVLNIPQRSDWRWLSLMRIIAALRCGRATVSLGTKDNSLIAGCCLQLDTDDVDWIGGLSGYVDGWDEAYRMCYKKYIESARNFEEKVGFPNDVIRYWRITDGV